MKKTNKHPSLVDIMNYQLGIYYEESLILHLKKCKSCLKKIQEIEEEILKNTLDKFSYSFEDQINQKKFP
jgi:hypothetical protein